MEENEGANVTRFLADILARAGEGAAAATTGDPASDAGLRKIVANSEKCRGVLTVLVTLLTYKALHPGQDIRYHQSNLPGGFSGRGFDTRFITPFMKENRFPCMSETGWLSRSLEQPYPYTLDYRGKIQTVKSEFLRIVDHVQCRNGAAAECLSLLFSLLLKQRESEDIRLAHPHHLSIAQIIGYLEAHFSLPCRGSARLPVLAVYSAYECMMREVGRYAQCRLLPLESHTSADTRSGRAGDIDVVKEPGGVFEAVEVKHQIGITVPLIQTAYEKFKSSPIDRYYLLTTARPVAAGRREIDAELARIARGHGCQVIVNGVYSTLSYYLRLLKDTDAFISRYIGNMASDPVIKYDHKAAWNRIVAGDA